MPKSSAEEEWRYSKLQLLEIAGEIKKLKRQPEFEFMVGDIKVFKYTSDFKYYDVVKKVWVIEEYKGHLFERHDSLLRIKIISALHPKVEFRIQVGKDMKKLFVAGEAVIQRKKKGKPK